MSSQPPAPRTKGLFSLQADNLVPIVLVLLLLHLALWTIFTGVSHRAPDWDNMEELVWASGVQWGYYKHPPLPSWILHYLTLIFGRPVWLTFFTGQLSVVLALWMLWKLGCEFTSQQRALIATLLVSLIAYFTVRGVMNNHNTMQLWAVAGAIWMFYRATKTDSLLAWAALGFFSACAFLTKYSALVQFATFFLYLLLTGSLKRVATWKGIALSTAILAVMVAPHLIWLKAQEVGPVAYAGHQLTMMSSFSNEISDLSDFLITNLGRITLMIVATFVVAIWASSKHGNQITKANVSRIADDLARSDKFFILFVGVAPLVLTLFIAGVMKVPLASHWATTFFVLFGFFSFWLLRSGNDVALLRKTIIIVVAFQIISAAGYGLARGPLADKSGRPSRATFPGAEISKLVHAEWTKRMQIPLTVVAADTWIGGNIATHIGRDVHVLIDGDYSKSPWINEEHTEQCGMLVAINRSKDNPDEVDPGAISLMAQATEHGTIEVPWTKKTNGPTVVVEWGIIPPREGCTDQPRTTH